MTYFTSDLHLGHANIIKYCSRPFASVEEMDAKIISNINTEVRHPDRDELVIAGDFCFGGIDKAVSYRERIACKNVRLVLGNHDLNLYNKHLVQFTGLFASVDDIRLTKARGHDLVVCHYAMRVWPGSHKGSWHLYGHSHGTLPRDESKSFDVGVDCWSYRPLSEAEVSNLFRKEKQ